MNQSRYSYQSNSHVPSDYGHLQRSTNSNNLNLPSHQNLNAGCALNYSPNLQAKFGNQQHIYLPHQNFTIPYQQIAVNGGGYLQSHQISHSNQMSHKVVMCSQSPQPPTFTANFPHQQIAFQNQNIKFPVQSNPAFQQSQASSQADDHTQKNVNRNAVIRPANNVPTTNQFSSVCNQPKLSINAKEAPSQSPLSSVLKSNPAK